MSFVKVGGFTATLILEHDTKADATITNARFTIQKAASKTLGFNKLSIDYKKIISKAELQARITGSDKAGYTITRIFDVTPSNIAELTGAGLHIKKTGDFTAKLTLVHAFYGDATVNASFTIRKGNAKNITFDKLTIPYQKTISKARLAQNLKGGKDGYTIQSIDNINPRDAAELTGVGLHIKKAGDFTARLTLTHAFYKDTNVNASFTIEKLPKKTLGFTKLVSPYKNFLTKDVILKRVTGEKDGYSIQSIDNINARDIAELTGVGLHIKKVGSFTANITLEHAFYKDVTITAEFQITKLPSKKLRFVTLNVTKDLLSKEDILKQVRGPKEGYTLRRISEISGSDVAEISGLAIKFKKVGSFTARIVLEHLIYSDVEITGAQFVAKQKIPGKKLAFNKIVYV